MKKIISIFLLSFFFFSISFAENNLLRERANKIINNFYKVIDSDPISKKNELSIYDNVAATMYKIYNKNKLKNNQKELLLYLLEAINKKINSLDSDYYDLNTKKIIASGTEPFWGMYTKGDTLYFTDSSVEKPEEKSYKITATIAQEEITLETAVGPFFEIKNQECINDMNGKKYNYSIIVYFGGIEKFRGCAKIEDLGNK